jgi:hypothetical protein
MIGHSIVLALASCIDPNAVRIYAARKFNHQENCLENYTSVATVSGPGGAVTCAPTCFLLDGFNYVSTVCPPLPDDAVVSDSQECREALAAYNDARMCASLN